MDQKPANRSFPLTTVLFIPAGFALGALAGLLLTNNQLESPLQDSADAIAVPVTVSTVRMPTPQPAIVEAPPAPPLGVQPIAPTPSPPVQPPPAEPAVPPSQTYTVVAGDTLTSIARRLGVDVQELIETNNITDPSSLAVGDVLVIP